MSKQNKNQKATDEEIKQAYQSEGSCRKAAKKLGMCTQSVHERCVRMGINKKINVFTEDEMEMVKALYLEGFLCGDGQLDALAKSLGRTKQFICRKAKSYGLTNAARLTSEDAIAEMSKRNKEWHKENKHPKGMLGKKHTKKTKEIIAEKSRQMNNAFSVEEKRAITIRKMKTKAQKGCFSPPRSKTTWKSGWRTIGGVRKYYRSAWEANYARHLERLKQNGNIKSWQHEPKIFWFDSLDKGAVGYLPDFRVITNSNNEEYHEVKGWMDERSQSKLRNMREYYPETTLVLIDAKEYQKIQKLYKNKINGWEIS